MITQNVVQRTFLLKHGTSLGTCFALDHNDRQYIVTARHVVEHLDDGSQIQLGYRGRWISGLARLVGHGNGNVDVSVISLERPIVRGDNIPTSVVDDVGVTYGQDMYFLGFPFGIYLEAGDINNHFPLPLVKNAIFSGQAKEGDAQLLLLDGINNRGFSGGPLVFRDVSERNGVLRVAAIIGGYRHQRAPVYQDDARTPFTIKENTGIIFSYSIKHALDLIDANAIGVPL